MEEVQKRLDERARARTDRLFLANEILGFDFSQETHKELFDTYPTFQEGASWSSQFPKRDVLVLWSRGHFKSTAVVVLAIQAILVNPDIRILLMQGSVKVTQTLLKQIACHFDGTADKSRLRELFPEFCGVKDEEGEWTFGKKAISLTSTQFTTPARKKKQLAQATVTVASPKSVKTGQHYDLGIFDDLVNDQNYRNPKQLDKIEQDFDMAHPLIDPGCPRFVSGTRYAFGDMYENIQRRDAGKNEWTISIKTCWLPDGSPRFPQHKTKDGRLVGFTREMLLQMMRDNPEVFASQYLNHPVSTATQFLTEQDLLNAVIAEKDSPPLSAPVLFVDLASEGIHPDDSVILAGRVDHIGKMYITDMRGGTYTVSQLALHVIDMSLRHRPLKIMIEKTSSAQYFVAYLQTVCRDKGIVLPLDYIKVNNEANAKNIRVQAMAGQVKNKRLFFFAGLPNWDKFVEQTTTFPKGRHGNDDWPDTAALMCQFFSTGYIGTSPRPITQHPMIARMMRDPVSQTFDQDQEMTVDAMQGTMGSDFV